MPSEQSISTFLPGRLWIQRGRWRDYRELERFHYRRGKPATSADVWTVRYTPTREHESRVVAVGVVSYPVPSCRSRRLALDITGSRSDELSFANQHIRTISRVIVHPQFRALGLSSILVRWICQNCPTRYVEALAVMGLAHPFFERGGMRRFDPAGGNPAVYYLFDREASQAAHRQQDSHQETP